MRKGFLLLSWCLLLVVACSESAPPPDRGTPMVRPRHSTAATGQRRALVIGNSDYHIMPDWVRLPNPLNDAEDIAAALQNLGFKVTVVKDATLKQMDNTIHQFSLEIQGGDLALLYYSGHGMQVKGENFLLPIDVEFEREDQVERVAIKASLVLEKLDRATTKLVFLDSCRVNPFVDRGTGVPRAGMRGGLAEMRLSQLSEGTLLVYSTSPDSYAVDGVGGRNSPFTQSLLEHLGDAGVDVQIMLRRVRNKVKTSTRGRQIPWDSSSLQGELYLAEAGTGVQKEDPQPGRLPPNNSNFSLAKLKEEESWKEWQGNMQSHFNETAAFQGSAATRREAWQLFLNDHKEDNPYSQDDERLRTAAQQQQAAIVDEPERQEFEPEMVAIPAGTFKMGSSLKETGRKDAEGPVHRVQVDAFQMGKYEVTRGQFLAFVDATGYKTTAEQGDGCYGWTGSSWEQKPEFNWLSPGFAQEDNHPVVCMSWDDAVAYTEWLANETGKPYRLPSEVEWEYAARAGTTTARFWGDNPDQACKYANVADQTKSPSGSTWTSKHECNDGYWFTAPVGSYSPNPWGLYDMLGNAWEWTCSQYDSNGYSGKETTCAEKGNSGARAVRGGSWGDVPYGVRAANRYGSTPSGRGSYLGFRAVQD